MTLHMQSKWCQCRYCSVIIRLQWNDCCYPEFRCVILLISCAEAVSCILPSWLCQFIKLYPLLPQPLHALLYSFGHYAHHPAVFVMCPQFALLCLFMIIIFPVLPIINTCKITHTDLNRDNHPVKSRFILSVCQFCDFSMLHIFILLLNCCLCIFNLLSCPSGFSLNKIPYPFVLLFIAWEVCFSLFLGYKLLFWSLSAQCPKGIDLFWFQATVAFIPLITSLGGLLYWMTISAHLNWREGPVRSMNHHCLH